MSRRAVLEFRLRTLRLTHLPKIAIGNHNLASKPSMWKTRGSISKGARKWPVLCRLQILTDNNCRVLSLQDLQKGIIAPLSVLELLSRHFAALIKSQSFYTAFLMIMYFLVEFLVSDRRNAARLSIAMFIANIQPLQTSMSWPTIQQTQARSILFLFLFLC